MSSADPTDPFLRPLASWLIELLEKLKELLVPERPVLVPVPVRTRPRRSRPSR